MELIYESTVYENWSKIEQEEWLASLVCVSGNQRTAFSSLTMDK